MVAATLCVVYPVIEMISVALSDTRDVHPQIKRSIGEMEQEIARLPPDAGPSQATEPQRPRRPGVV